MAKVARSYRLDAELVASMEIRAEALGQPRTVFVERALRAALERFETGAESLDDVMSSTGYPSAPVAVVPSRPSQSSRASGKPSWVQPIPKGK